MSLTKERARNAHEEISSETTPGYPEIQEELATVGKRKKLS